MDEGIEWDDAYAPWIIKMTRAWGLHSELRTAVDQYESSGAYRTSWLYDPASLVGRLVFHVDRPVPPALSAITGDLIHNLRSALDSVSYALARRHLWRRHGLNLDTDRRARRPFFPVKQDEAEFTALFAKRGTLHGLYGDLDVAALRSAQPFVLGPTPPEFQRDVALEPRPWHWLQLLEDMWNIDKHRMIHVGAVRLDDVHFGVRLPDGTEAIQVYRVEQDLPLHDGDDIMSIPFPPGSEVPPEFRPNVNFRLGFGFLPEAREQIDVGRLRALITRTDQTIRYVTRIADGHRITQWD